MEASTLDLFTRKWLIDSIRLYQRQISPRKGFSCPHRLLYGDHSCSEHVQALLAQYRLVSAMPLVLERFKACTQAAQTLSLTEANGGFKCIVIPCCFPI